MMVDSREEREEEKAYYQKVTFPSIFAKHRQSTLSIIAKIPPVQLRDLKAIPSWP